MDWEGRGAGDTTQPTMDTKARTLSPLETFLENAGSLLGHRPSSQRRSVAGEPLPGPSLPSSRRRCCRGRGPQHRKVFPRRGARGEGVRMRGGHLRAERTPPLPGPAPGREAGTRSPQVEWLVRRAGLPAPGGPGAGCCKRLSTSPCTCAVCGVPCACMLVQGRTEVYTHTHAHTFVHACAPCLHLLKQRP